MFFGRLLAFPFPLKIILTSCGTKGAWSRVRVWLMPIPSYPYYLFCTCVRRNVKHLFSWGNKCWFWKHLKTFRIFLCNQKLARTHRSTPKTIVLANTSFRPPFPDSCGSLSQLCALPLTNFYIACQQDHQLHMLPLGTNTMGSVPSQRQDYTIMWYLFLQL